MRSKKRYFFAADYKNRIIWLKGEICERSEQDVLRALKRMNKTVGPICFYLSGPGGVFVSAISIGNAVISSANHILGIAHGEVASACFLLTQYFEVCAAIPGAKFTFHHAVCENTWEEEITQGEACATLEFLRRTDAIQFLLFSRKAKDINKVHNLFENQKTISARTARRLGLVDRYLSKSDFNIDKRKIRKLIKAR